MVEDDIAISILFVCCKAFRRPRHKCGPCRTFVLKYINQHNQSTVTTIQMAISNMFFKQKSEIKHMQTMSAVMVKICVYLLDVLFPIQHKKGHVEPVNEK